MTKCLRNLSRQRSCFCSYRIINSCGANHIFYLICFRMKFHFNNRIGFYFAIWIANDNNCEFIFKRDHFLDNTRRIGKIINVLFFPDYAHAFAVITALCAFPDKRESMFDSFNCILKFFFCIVFRESGSRNIMFFVKFFLNSFILD